MMADHDEGKDDESEAVVEQRIYGCDLIEEASIHLELPQVCAATAQTLFHRFYARRSFARHDVRHVAMGVLFLAAKVEESPRRVRDVLNVFNALFQHRDDGSHALEPLDLNSERYLRMKQLVVGVEAEVLTELGFLLYTEHPHKFILNYVRLICPDPSLEQQLAQRAWNVINDSARTDLCLRFAPEAICCAAISMAARALRLPLPTQPPWWEVFEVAKAGARLGARARSERAKRCGRLTRARPSRRADADVDRVSGQMADLYARPKAQYRDLKTKRPSPAAGPGQG